MADGGLYVVVAVGDREGAPMGKGRHRDQLGRAWGAVRDALAALGGALMPERAPVPIPIPVPVEDRARRATAEDRGAWR